MCQTEQEKENEWIVSSLLGGGGGGGGEGFEGS